MSTTPSFRALWNNEQFECWRIDGGMIRFKRPGEVGFKAMSKDEFRRYFQPMPGETFDEPVPQAVQGGLFG